MALKLPNGLTIRQDEFARNVATGMDQKAAAIAAGYSPKGAAQSASELMRDELIMAAIDKIRDRALERTELDAAWVFEGVRRIRDEGLKTLPVTDKRGDIIGEKPVDLGAAARVTEMGAKLLGMMVDRQSIELSGDVKKVLEAMVSAISTEIEDPALRERIILRLQGAISEATH